MTLGNSERNIHGHLQVDGIHPSFLSQYTLDAPIIYLWKLSFCIDVRNKSFNNNIFRKSSDRFTFTETIFILNLLAPFLIAHKKRASNDKIRHVDNSIKENKDGEEIADLIINDDHIDELGSSDLLDQSDTDSSSDSGGL